MRKPQHPSNLFSIRTALAAAVLTVAAVGCRCGPPPTEATHPDFIVDKTALSFEACPSVDENGDPVEGVFPDKQVFTLENIGKSSGTVTLTIEGDGADRYSVNPDTKPDSIAPGSSNELEVLFDPTASGDATATLVIEDGDETTEPVRVALQGTGINLPAQPTIKITYDTGSGSLECTPDINGEISNCQILFPDTFLEQTAYMDMTVENVGCPTLQITGMSMAPLTAGEQVQFYMEEPALPPSEDSPVSLSVVDGKPSMAARFRFGPEDNGTLDGQRYAILSVKSNARTSPTSLVTLFGYAKQPAVYVTPSFCDFTDAADTCGGTKVFTTGTNAQATFQITNGGNSDIQVESVSFRGTPSGRFAVGGTNPEGLTIAPGASVPLVIDYTDAPVYVTDLVDITATDQGVSAGVATIRLSGGVLPELYTNPGSQLDFSGTMGTTVVKPVEICNETGAGTLVIKKVSISQNPQFFKVLNPPAAGTEIAGGMCAAPVDVEFTRPVSGGLQAGTLEIQSNDPDYAPTSHYKLSLYSQVPLNQFPVAVLEGPAGQTGGFSVSLASLNPKRITLHATNSYDPPNNTPVATYTYYLGKSPPNSTASLTEPGNMAVDVDGVEVTHDTVDLNLDPTITGEYRIYLTVHDDTGQASANSARLDIIVNQ